MCAADYDPQAFIVPPQPEEPVEIVETPKVEINKNARAQIKNFENQIRGH